MPVTDAELLVAPLWAHAVSLCICTQLHTRMRKAAKYPSAVLQPPHREHIFRAARLFSLSTSRGSGARGHRHSAIARTRYRRWALHEDQVTIGVHVTRAARTPFVSSASVPLWCDETSDHPTTVAAVKKPLMAWRDRGFPTPTVSLTGTDHLYAA